MGKQLSTVPTAAGPRASMGLSIIFGCKPTGAIVTARSATARPLLVDTSSSIPHGTFVDPNEQAACTYSARCTGDRDYEMGSLRQPTSGSVDHCRSFRSFYLRSLRQNKGLPGRRIDGLCFTMALQLLILRG